MDLKIIECKGSPREIGLQYGEAFKSEIIEHFQNMKKPPKEAWKKRLPIILKTIKKQTPFALEELRGIAKATGLNEDDIFKLNFKLWDHQLDLEGCSNLIFTRGPDGPVLGKNNDGLFQNASWKYVAARKITPNHGIPFITISFAGTLSAGNTINEYGLSTGESSVGSVFQQSDRYIPIQIYGYECISKAKSTYEFTSLLTQQPVQGKGSSMAVIDANSIAVGLEIACPYIQVRHPENDNGLSCVNCFQLPSLTNADKRKPKDKEDALSRVKHFNQILQSDASFDAKYMKKILMNHEGQAVCRHGIEINSHETAFSYISLPQKREIHICQGHPCKGDFTILNL